MAERAFLRAVWGPAVVLAAFLATGLLGPMAFAFVGLLVGEPFLQVAAQPVAALAAGLGAALAASWTATLLSPMRTRTRILRVVLWSEAAAAVGVLALEAMAFLDVGATNAARLAPLVLLVTGASAFTAVRAQAPRASLRRDALVSLGLLLLIPALLYGVLGLACLADQCGA